MGGISKDTIASKYQLEFKNHYDLDSFCTAISPGRINIIGEHTDYNLGLAMPIGIDRWVCSVVSIRSDSKVNIYSSNFDKKVSLNISELDSHQDSWVKYSAGCVKILNESINASNGYDILVGGNVPIGFGMSSSAALEVSLLGALVQVLGLKIDKRNLLSLANKVEKDILGIKSGLLDQYASIYSKKDSPILIDFSSLTHLYVKSQIKEASWVLINSMVDRSLVDSKYNQRVEECQNALKKINTSQKNNLKINEISDFDLTLIKDNKVLYDRLHHILSENKRVKLMKNALESGNIHAVGKILNESHLSLAKKYDVSCKEINDILCISNKIEGFYGGRIMGGGFGGCCLCLVDDSKKDKFVTKVFEGFYNKYKYDLKVEFVKFSEGLSFFD